MISTNFSSLIMIYLIFMNENEMINSFRDGILYSRSRFSSQIPLSLTSSTPNERSFFFSQKPYSDVGLSGKVMDGVLTYLNIDRPSKIQALSYNEIYSGSNCIVADQTGSGKTLAYLLPLMQRIMELQRNKTIPLAQEKAPYVVIITPTTELAVQVSKVVKSLAHVLKFRTACVTSNADMDSEQKKIRMGAEVINILP